MCAFSTVRMSEQPTWSLSTLSPVWSSTESKTHTHTHHLPFSMFVRILMDIMHVVHLKFFSFILSNVCDISETRANQSCEALVLRLWGFVQ